jgi:hypothetical protein
MLIKADRSGIRLAEEIRLHLQRVSSLYAGVVSGENIQAAEKRGTAETNLANEIKRGLERVRIAIEDLGRPRPIIVKVASPKPAWAHVYYLSLHDPANSTRPTEGFYPVFLLSTDHHVCWLSVCLAAGTVEISGRGGWSQPKGLLLKQRANLLGSPVKETNNWKKGPIELGPNRSFLHLDSKTTFHTARAYECGAIISTAIDPHDPPDNLPELILQAFAFYDDVLANESDYIESALPLVSGSDWNEQVNAAITGRKAESYVLQGWFSDFHPEWGPPVDKTSSAGLGYDFEFPEAELFVEVKGFRGPVDTIRLTDREWRRAREEADKFVLCLVSRLDKKPHVDLLYDPYKLFSVVAVKKTRLQITYSILKKDLVANV